jgi:peptidoglycan/xylan/chitin deacetylase (PgdA/CDA1 family)
MASAKATLTLFIVVAFLMAGCGSSTEPATKETKAPAAKRPTTKPDLPTAAEQTAAIAKFSKLGRPIYCGGKAKPWVALTFDDGPGPYTERVLALLNRRHIRRTFFINGKNVATYRDALRHEARSRSAVGNHTWSHKLLTSLDAEEQKREIISSQRAIARVTGRPVNLFRPPYGAHDKYTDRIVRRSGAVTILWDIDSEDALGANYKEISRHVKHGFRPGSIILLHENRGQTLRALKYTILPALKKSKVIPVTVPEMLAGNPPSTKQLRRGRDGCAR